MTKNELIEALQKVEGNPQIVIGINKSWGKECHAVTSFTPLYKHDGHKVDSNACIFEVNCDHKLYMSDEELAARHREFIHKKYGPLDNCGIDDRFWAVNGPWFDKWNREKIEQLEAKIARLEKENHEAR